MTTRQRDKLRSAAYRRSKGRCHLCNLYISPSQHFNNVLGMSIDHIRPRSLGGANTQNNVLAAHMCCNSIRLSTPLQDITPEFRRHLRRTVLRLYAERRKNYSLPK